MNVLITRPDERGQQLVELLAKEQIFAIHQPLFSVVAGRELPLLPSMVSGLKAGDFLFAVSKNAVDFAHQTLTEIGFGWRSDLQYIAVGQATASYLASHSTQAVRYPLKFANSEGLLELPEMQNLQGRTILILRAESGREFFAEQAKQRGAEVKVLECYQRIPFTQDMGNKISLAKRAGIDTIIATSSDIVSMLVAQTREEDREWLFQCRLMVVSPRIAKDAQQFGWQAKSIDISEKADNHSLLNALLKS
ncbi:uroporphyrinogen-III synthase [Pasteurellaceae bacterium Orientalotternb1]|nr:uroporphyrinogen-III synthase [Pasteurellaceae bacterium Orientalotternb1]